MTPNWAIKSKNIRIFPLLCPALHQSAISITRVFWQICCQWISSMRMKDCGILIQADPNWKITVRSSHELGHLENGMDLQAHGHPKSFLTRREYAILRVYVGSTELLSVGELKKSKCFLPSYPCLAAGAWSIRHSHLQLWIFSDFHQEEGIHCIVCSGSWDDYPELMHKCWAGFNTGVLPTLWAGFAVVPCLYSVEFYLFSSISSPAFLSMTFLVNQHWFPGLATDNHDWFIHYKKMTW